MSDTEAPRPAEHLSPSCPRVTIDDRSVVYVSVGMSALSPNSVPVTLALGKAGWSHVVSLSIKPETHWLDAEWVEYHLEKQGLTRAALVKEGLSARAAARLAASVLRGHVPVARMAGFQRRFYEQLLELVDDPYPDRWVEFDMLMALAAQKLAVGPQRVREIAGSLAAAQPADAMAASDVMAQLSLLRALTLDVATNGPPGKPASTITLTSTDLAHSTDLEHR